MRVVATALLVAVIAVGCGSAEHSSTADPAPTTVGRSSTTTLTDVTPANSGTVVAIEEPTTPLFSGDTGEIWRRAWVDLDVEVLAGFFTEKALINGAGVDRAMAEALARHPDPMEWVETHEDCVYHNPRFATCDVRWTSAMHRPAGLEVPVQRAVFFSDDGRISMYREDVRFDTVIAFEIAIAEWLAEEHPEIPPVDWETDDHDRYASTVRGVLTVVDEFVAWSPDYPPGTTVVDEPILTGTIAGVDVYNASDDQLALVGWAMDRIAASGLEPPPLTHVTFPPTVACERGFSGMAFHTDVEGHIDVCTESPTFAASAALPLTARRTILHELGHIWTVGHTTEASRAAFMGHLGIESWADPRWEASGTEMAAEIFMWGLMDDEVSVRVPGNTCEDRVTAFTLLTGRAPLARSCSGT